MLALFWAGMLVLRFVTPMLGGDPPEKRPGPRVLVPLAVLTLAGFIYDQFVHGRFFAG